MKAFLGPCLETFFGDATSIETKKPVSGSPIRSCKDCSAAAEKGGPHNRCRGVVNLAVIFFFCVGKTLIKIVTNCLLPVIWQDDWTWLLMSILEYPGFMYFGWVVYDHLFINIIIVMSLSLSSLLSLLWLYIYCYILFYMPWLCSTLIFTC